MTVFLLLVAAPCVSARVVCEISLSINLLYQLSDFLLSNPRQSMAAEKILSRKSIFFVARNFVLQKSILISIV